MTASPEKAAQIPSVNILDGFRPEPAIDTAMFITPARMRFLVARATMPYSTADDVERSIREAIEDTVRVIKQHLADREARPSLPGSREERYDRRWIAVDPSGLRGPERVTRLPQRANQWERQGYVVTEWVRARQGGNNG